MPTITDALTYDGAVIRVEVGVSTRYRRSLFAAGRPIPQPNTLTALIDTGAQQTCLDSAVAAALRLPPIRGILPLNVPTLGGLSYRAAYEIDLSVLHPSGNAADHLVVRDLPVADLALNALGFDLLLGRDVLALCDFAYLGRRGAYTVTY